ncbi:hypothetical protein [Pseudoxanthomonas koreensis]|uniref:hypothetical protein n=1 Tax=Pseudoxanthomonas koreensis TaxID=266061 RepID=UPI00139116E2|nr:hypothetical protein [Pseudoxanthomonas koreensis]KAF1694946.1 hypothetical protein CSC64_03715 [Pseudoxanthomonas koreensis]
MQRLEKKRLSIELAEGVYIDVDVQPVLSGTAVPIPPPKLIARFAVGVDDCSGKSQPMELEILVAVSHRSAD